MGYYGYCREGGVAGGDYCALGVELGDLFKISWIAEDISSVNYPRLEFASAAPF